MNTEFKIVWDRTTRTWSTYRRTAVFFWLRWNIRLSLDEALLRIPPGAKVTTVMIVEAHIEEFRQGPGPVTDREARVTNIDDWRSRRDRKLKDKG